MEFANNMRLLHIKQNEHETGEKPGSFEHGMNNSINTTKKLICKIQEEKRRKKKTIIQQEQE